MDINEISFENLPKAVAQLAIEIAEIKLMIQNVQVYESKEKSVPIGIEEVSRLIGKAKPTIYALVRQRKIPCYKYGKKLYFFEEELLEWISKGKKKTIQEIESEVLKYNHNRNK
ncbi:DNA-binding protein [Flavobacterium cupreum]|uniref:DNA-binding protein n=2 Tax=Flavobacterium TaxID=237 RepID=A0A4Y7UEA0_9FLAO|nr:MULTISPECIES: helix-turn-helix domain-containing protein [Flavobacterium]RUT67926.1 DNA-binding protein [Flavobacterium cupreum]TCN59469.1 excisionase family DNA binding protein [Flavobacterium circumlabens]TEB44773.1 DNA-binding protein [Flavobacterium circumlabens]